MSRFKRVADQAARTSPNDFTTLTHEEERWDTSAHCGHAPLSADKRGEKLRFHHLQTGVLTNL